MLDATALFSEHGNCIGHVTKWRKIQHKKTKGNPFWGEAGENQRQDADWHWAGKIWCEGKGCTCRGETPRHARLFIDQERLPILNLTFLNNDNFVISRGCSRFRFYQLLTLASPWQRLRKSSIVFENISSVSTKWIQSRLHPVRKFRHSFPLWSNRESHLVCPTQLVYFSVCKSHYSCTVDCCGTFSRLLMFWVGRVANLCVIIQRWSSSQ